MGEYSCGTDIALIRIRSSWYYNQSVQNPGAKIAMIGEYIKGSPASYDQRAKIGGFRYLSMETKLNAQFKLRFPALNAWWELINAPFMHATANARKTIYLTVDPQLIRPGT